MLYRVSWEIEIEAKSPESAAKGALNIQRSCEARRQWADLGFGDPSVFKVEGEDGHLYLIDLGKVK